MEEHAVPKQITTFEFKLIGFLTIRQFLYILIFSGFGYLIYLIAPFRLLGFIGGGISAGIGAAFAFIRFNDRPLDHALRMFFLRVTSPSQYFFSAENKPTEVRNVSYPSMTTTQLQQNPEVPIEQPQTIQQTPLVQTLQQPPTPAPVAVPHEPSLPLIQSPPEQPLTTMAPTPAPPTPLPSTDQPTISDKKPFITGVIMNTKEFPLPNMLVYIKDSSQKVVRLLKTTERGQFSSYQPLEDGTYTLEIQDPQQRFFFDPMTIMVRDQATSPQTIISKELL